MVSKSTLAMLDFTCIEDYFEYIIDSKDNGQQKQACDLYDQLSEAQKASFFRWVDETYYYEAQDESADMITELQKLKSYLNATSFS
jgi:hypothetical protein